MAVAGQQHPGKAGVVCRRQAAKCHPDKLPPELKEMANQLFVWVKLAKDALVPPPKSAG